MSSIKTLRSSILLVFIFGTGLFCQTTKNGDDTRYPADAINKAEKLKFLKKIYKPAACFNAGFRIKVTTPDGRTQKANGSLRVDNKNERMRFKFTVPYIGITLSKITIASDMVYVSNPHARKKKDRKFSLPLKYFQVRGLGQNSISLPFSLFQDLLFARLPEVIFLPDAIIKETPEMLAILIKKETEEYNYHFKKGRLRRLIYHQLEKNNKVDVSLKGTYKKTVFPKTMELIMNPGLKNAEKMHITFRSLNLKARCTDPYFPHY